MTDPFACLDALSPAETKLSQLSQLDQNAVETRKAAPVADSQLSQLSQLKKSIAGEKREARAASEGPPENFRAQEEAIHVAFTLGFFACAQLGLDSGLWTWATQQGGHECRNCMHLFMAEDLGASVRARRFFWRCSKGHRQLEAGLRGERIIIAPASCQDFLDTAEGGKGRGVKSLEREAG